MNLFRALRKLVCLAGAGLLPLVAAEGHRLRLEIVPCFGGTPLHLDDSSLTNSAGQHLSVTRLDALISHPRIRQTDGIWVEAANPWEYVSARRGRLEITLTNLPSGSCDRLRFDIGVPPVENHGDPTVWAPDHPLNPQVNGLHWNWRGGYVFLALEGQWLTSDARWSGYSYHLATDRLLMTVELPLALDLSTDFTVRLRWEIDRIFPAHQRFTGENTSTHSRTNDVIAEALNKGVERSFAVESVRAAPVNFAPRPVRSRTEVAAAATPYRLTFARYFPQPNLPLDNPLTEEGVELGRRLFLDPRLSGNERQSCGSCHRADRAFTDVERFSLGAEGQPGSRNAMPLLNLAWKQSYFWDGRASTLREQALQPIQNPIEMHASLPRVVEKLQADPGQRTLFERAFGTPEITPDRKIGRAHV